MRSSSLLLLLLLLLTIIACQNQAPAKDANSSVAISSKSRPNSQPVSKTLKPLPSAAPGYNYPNVSGYYKEADEEQADSPGEGCNIAVTILKSNVGYRYRLTAGQTHHTGKVTLEKNQNKSIGITFEDIPYAEYEGDVSKLEENKDRPQPKLPVGVGGILSGDTITIQNYGNAMNYYVQFGGCQVKFISLVRVHH